MKTYDCLIIGGGPAGLTAALYMARFRRSTLVIDNKQSRALWIPKSHNFPGSPDGISGKDILESLRDQLDQYSAEQCQGTVTALARDGDGFIATIDGSETVTGGCVILATGIVDEKPNLPRMPDFVFEGNIRFCPICDGYEAMDQRIGVIGPMDTAVKKAVFLRTYSSNITLLPLGDAMDLNADQTKLLQDAGIPLPLSPVNDLYGGGDCIAAELRSGQTLKFDVIYPAMGAHVRSELARDLGLKLADGGCICTNDHHCTSISGLYAIGDVSTELHQISVAFGHAAIAATDAHNHLERNFK